MALWLSACHSSTAAITIVDTFDQGGFSISSPGGPNPSDEIVNLPLGQRRMANLNPPPPRSFAAMMSTLNSSTGEFTLLIIGTSSSPGVPLSLDLIYSAGGPYDITGCTGFILGFSELAGAGSLYIELGSSSDVAGIQRLDLSGPGEIFYPLADMGLNSIHTLDSFNVLRFVFEARSTEFSFTLDEIRLVPEPSGALLALAAGAGLLARRRRI